LILLGNPLLQRLQRGLDQGVFLVLHQFVPPAFSSRLSTVGLTLVSPAPTRDISSVSWPLARSRSSFTITKSKPRIRCSSATLLARRSARLSALSVPRPSRRRLSSASSGGTIATSGHCGRRERMLRQP